MSDAFLAELRRDGLVHRADARITALPGGVSSDICLVEEGSRRFVVKRALPKLRVRDDWFAGISRNATERDFIDCVGGILPGAVPRLLPTRSSSGYFAMEYLGAGYENWKTQLLRGQIDSEPAVASGALLGRLQRLTRDCGNLRRRFDTMPMFCALRLEPYLRTTGQRHPALRHWFEDEADRLATAREVLVHGDFSPKNILVSATRIVLLDCEAACYGDAAFDPAFLLNHLFLKALGNRSDATMLATAIDRAWKSFLAHASGDGAAGKDAVLERRVTRLLLLLMLARVDGKSPVEYLLPPQQEVVRTFVAAQLATDPHTLDRLCHLWFEAIAESRSEHPVA